MHRILIRYHEQSTLGFARVSHFKKEEIAQINAWLESLPPKEQPIELLKWANSTLARSTWVQFTSFGMWSDVYYFAGMHSCTRTCIYKCAYAYQCRAVDHRLRVWRGMCVCVGPSGIVVTDLLNKLGLLSMTKVIMIDTLHLFPETYDLMEKAQDFFGLKENGLIFRFLIY
jgi:3'-phosphoadenosine 5'-phosphosulfate sulfotransferase (PAPS reductase)/FAD synthetase